jgi:hypothetical protein
MAAVVMAPKAVAVKEAAVKEAAGQQAVAVAQEMAVVGQVERASLPAEGAAMHRLAVAKSRLGAAVAYRFRR